MTPQQLQRDSTSPHSPVNARKKIAVAGFISTLVFGAATACGPADTMPNAIPNTPGCSDKELAGVETHSADGSAVATSDYATSKVACDILRDGGNATDAVVAAQLMLGLTEPQSSGPGGGSLAVYSAAGSQETEGYDGTVYSPKDYKDTSADSSKIGVPTTLNLLRSLNKDKGSKSLKELAQPAIDAAQNGFEVTESLATAFADQHKIIKDSDGLKQLYGIDESPAAGDTLTNKDYAHFLRSWSDNQGEISDQVMNSLSEDVLHNSNGRTSDRLAETWAADRNNAVQPTSSRCGNYANWELCGVDSNAVGTNVVLTTTGILDYMDVGRLTPYTNGNTKVPRATAAHLITEAEHIAFADANTWMGDPGEDPELRQLATDYRDDVVTNTDFHKKSAARIKQKSTMDTVEPTQLAHGDYADFGEEGTSHMSIRDAAGNTISMTSTLAREFGSGLAAGGFFLNNSLRNFSDGDADMPNAVRPLAHPKTMMAPLIAHSTHGETLAIGSPGGSDIPSYNIKAAVAMMAWRTSPLEAVQMPNFGTSGRKGAYIEGPFADGENPDVQRIHDRLDEWGQRVKTQNARSGLGIIHSSGKGTSVAADQRRGGVAMSAK